ncbi:CD209 antigen-like protein C isoform X2 [Clupea harengus]|uniref:CD209 antigen-like protein C isoform X2 n=1 Tax=Clupea harengus TaxID=7950 RepID=A0A6P8GBX2_CLUHA|nr:CD209 antigen-like protein C isoform X2 [Clupea harengus]
MAMDNAEHYTSLHEFTEEHSPRGASGVKRGVECLRGQTALVVFTVLLASVCANIVLGVLLFNRSYDSTSQIPSQNPNDLSPVLKLNSMQTRYNRLCKDYSDLGDSCSKTVRKCSPCPEGWLHLEDKCYHFSPDKMDWEKSRESCDIIGSHLAILYSHTQHDLLEVEAKKIGGFDYHFWIGLSDMETEGIWKWVDNRIVNDTYWSQWESEPNNHQSGGIHGEDCAVLDSRSKSWFDVPCDHIYKRICQMDAFDID